MTPNDPQPHLFFQLATYAFDAGWAARPDDLGPLLSRLVKLGADQCAVIEVISEDEDMSGGVAVFISVADGTPDAPPQSLSCWLALTNRVGWCDLGRRNGFPIVEAEIALNRQENCLEIKAAHYAFQDPEQLDSGPRASALILGPLLTVERIGASTIAYAGKQGPDLPQLKPSYQKYLTVPNAAAANDSVLLREYPWTPLRTNQLGYKETASVRCQNSRYPNLVQLLSAQRRCELAWVGRITNPMFEGAAPTSGETPKPAGSIARTIATTTSAASVATSTTGTPPPANGPPALKPWYAAPRQDLFGPPRFAFDDVEIVGFRLDLSGQPQAMAKLNDMVHDLNFHLESSDGRYADDFRYAVATPLVVIELLRYGRMRLTKNWPPVRTLDYQAQHELLVRVLVGRLDDDTGQARDAAVHVPAIFVDNPWSKALGREVQGFSKVMAAFCVPGINGPIALSMDGRLPDASQEDPASPLMDINRVCLVSKVGEPGPDLLRILYASSVDERERFEPIDLRGAGGTITPSSGPWRQSDFDSVEFRRSFARPVVAGGFTGFRSLQVSPVDMFANIGTAGRTWVAGTMRTRKMRYRFPAGLATLEFPTCDDAPSAWKKLQALTGESMSFSTGSWYRAQCSMVLEIEDGLRW